MMQRVFLIALSFLLAITLTIVPIPAWALWLRPLWVPMTLCCWVLLFPELVGLGVAFSVGIILDVLSMTLLGEHALILCVIAFMMAKLQRRLQNLPTPQHAVAIFWMMTFYQVGHYWIQAMVNHTPGTWLYWLPILSSVLIWLPLYSTCRSLSRSEGLRALR